jgi:hypothetical protein
MVSRNRSSNYYWSYVHAAASKKLHKDNVMDEIEAEFTTTDGGGAGDDGGGGGGGGNDDSQEYSKVETEDSSSTTTTTPEFRISI